MPQPNRVRPNGAEIRRLRREAGLKPGAFAKSVGISYSHLANVENGHHTGVAIEVLFRIANGLKQPIERLIDVPADSGAGKGPTPTGPPPPYPPTREDSRALTA